MGEAPSVAASTPKLLELDKRDVEAVRSFLPGKVLGRTAALLALVVLVLGFAGSLDVAVEKFLGFPLEPPWLKYAVLIGLPVLIVGAQIVAEWQAERQRKQAQALAVKVDAVPEGYFRIGPYLDTAEDRAKFDRADRIHEKVVAWIKRSDAAPLYLTGDSGSGKSSVLSAFALPELREAGWTVVEARAWQDPEA
jgi:chloramphenicol 3-O-phosphotransferase